MPHHAGWAPQTVALLLHQFQSAVQATPCRAAVKIAVVFLLNKHSVSQSHMHVRIAASAEASILLVSL